MRTTVLIILSLVVGYLDLVAQITRCPVAQGDYPVIGVNPAFEAQLARWADDHGDHLLPRFEMMIPVIFHVIWLETKDNISDEQILSQLDALNRDFSGQNENLRGLPARFRQLAANVGIRFCLPFRDAEGQPVDAIRRVQTDDPDLATRFDLSERRYIHYTMYGGSDAHDPEHFLNVWIYPLDGILGFATFPDEAPFPGEDGIVIDPRFLGSIHLGDDSRPYNKGHTLTHETGHYLGLHHTWGPGNGGCQQDDFVEDTPVQNGPYFDCPPIPQFSCDSEDHFMNFMDFTHDGCLSFFTGGQKDRMLQVIGMSRPGIFEKSFTCGPSVSHPYIPPLDELVGVRYLRDEQKILIWTETRVEEEITVSLVGMDGRLILDEEYTDKYSLWLPSSQLPHGVYIVFIQKGKERHAQKIAIY